MTTEMDYYELLGCERTADGATIKAAQAAGDADLGDTYYQHWVDTLEALLIAKGVTDADTLHALEHRIAETPTGRHTHVARREPVIVA